MSRPGKRRTFTKMGNIADRVYPGEHLKLKEVFPTIQGEGPYVGQPAVFLRLAGCNLACWFCDTDFAGGNTESVARILKRVEDAQATMGLPVIGQPLVVLTGGEPLAQPVRLLVNTLIGNGYRVQIETDGVAYTDLPDAAPHQLTIVCSPKTPKLHPKTLPRITAFKYLVRATDRRDVDGLPWSSTQDPDGEPRPLAKPRRNAPVYLQPLAESDPEATAKNTALAVHLAMKHGYHLSLQTHKILDIP